MKKKVIGICMSRIYQENQTYCIKAICKHAERHNMKLLIFNTFSCLKQNPNSPESKIFDVINYDILDAIIIFPDHLRNEKIIGQIIKNAKAKKLPVITIGEPRKGCSTLFFDYLTAFEELIEHVITEHDCKSVKMISAEKGNAYSEARINSFKKVLDKYGLPTDDTTIYHGNFEEKLTYRIIDEILEKEILPNAIICANDEMALAACDRLHEKGYNVPGHVIITGFDGAEQEKYHTPRLTTCIMDWDEFGEAVFDLLEEQFKNTKALITKTVAYKLQINQSCSCMPMEITDANYRTYENNRHKKNRIVFNEKLFECAHEVSKNKTFKDYFKKMSNEMVLIKCSTFRLCLVDGFITKTLSEKTLFEDTPQDYSKTTPLMQAAFVWKNGKQEHPSTFLRSEMLPDVEEVMSSSDENIIFFFPVTFDNKYIGYVATEIDIDKADFTNIFSYMLNFNNSIEIIKSNNDKGLAINMLKDMYSKDQMTELYNRRGFYTTLSKIIKEADTTFKLILYSIDMDGMKYINDNFGHHEGDEAIKAVGRAITKACNAVGGIGARFGGDEFVAAFISENAEQDKQAFYSTLVCAIEEYNRLAEKEYAVQTSVGDSTNELSTNIDDCIKAADARMYSDKKKKKCRSTRRES